MAGKELLFVVIELLRCYFLPVRNVSFLFRVSMFAKDYLFSSGF